MKEISLKKIQHYTGGTLSRVSDIEITNISTNSKEIPENCLFIPIKGEKFDGHDYILEAIYNGAVAILSHDSKLHFDVPTIYVDDTRCALLDIAAGYRGRMNIPVVGLTGSVGKTTTKEMVWSVLQTKFNTLKTEGNFNNQIGLPLTIFRLDDTYQAAVFEMGMSAFGEIASMTIAARPNIAIITNIGVSHIEFLGSREGICKAKLEILGGLKADGFAVLNGDEPLLYDKKDELGVKAIYFGINNPKCDYRAENIRIDHYMVIFDICYGKKRFEVTLNAPGRHNVMNALAAAVAGHLMGISDKDIAKGLNNFRTVGMRQNIFEKKGFIIYEDCYNASPDSIEAALEAIKEINNDGEKVAVLGSILELGSYADEGHFRVGKKAAQCADRLYLYGEGAQKYKQGALSEGMCEDKVKIFDKQDILAAALRKDCKQGDVLLFKGSRSMKMETALKLFLEEEK